MKPWFDSKTVRGLAKAALLLVLAWLGLAVGTGSWDWRPLVLGLIAIVTPAIQRMGDADVVAPPLLDFLNRNNLDRLPPREVPK